jgi:hypothetical protein
MKKTLILICFFLHFGFPALTQKKLYLPDSSFKFKLAKFKMPLYNKNEIVGIFKDYFLIRTSINNNFTLLLINKEGAIIQNFEGDWQLPENWQTEDGLWLYQVSESQQKYGYSRITILKYHFSTKSIEYKAFELKDYFQYSSIKPVMSDEAFLCGNIQQDIVVFRFNENDIKIIKADNRNILRFMYDGKRGIINVFEVALSASSRDEIKFYQFPISEVPDFNKHFKWQKSISALKMTEFYYFTQIRFVSSEEFIITPGKFEDNLTIAAKYDLEGRINSKFTLANVAGLQKDALTISFLDNTWFLTCPHLSGLIYQSPSSDSKEILLNGYSLVQMPGNFQSENFVFADTSYIIKTIDTRNLQLKKHEYTIPVAEKSYELLKVHTMDDGSYWVSYKSPNGTYVKYNSSDEEVYRTPDSLRLLNNRNSFYQINNNQVLIATYKLASSDNCTNCNLVFDKYLKVDSKNHAELLHPSFFLDGNEIYYCDTLHRHFYVLSDSLKRYNFDFTPDSTFRVKTKTQTPLMLVSKQGNIYLGQDLFSYKYSYKIDSLYKLNSNGNEIWRKAIISGQPNAYSSQSGGTIYGGAYPIFNKEDVIIWGTLTCGEGCYTSNNMAITENDKLVNLSYLNKLENNGPGYSFLDKYGVFMKNYQTFLAYNPTTITIEKDTNTSIKLSSYNYEIRELDVLPDQDLLIIEQNKLNKYSYRKTIWASIQNLEKEEENNSHFYWNLSAADAINKQIKLDVYLSDNSPAILKVLPENSNVAYIKNQTLFFTGKEGSVAVFAQSVKGGEPYTSPEFTVRKSIPPFTITIVEGGLYVNRPTAIKFESVEGISLKIDSLGGSCLLKDNKIEAILPFSSECRVYYSWTGSDIYSSGNSVTYIGLSADLLLSDEEPVPTTSIFPNPLTNNMLTIKSPQLVNSINVVDIKGQKKHFSANAKDNKQSYYFSEIVIPSDFAPGIYMIEILDKHGEIIRREKLIISK